mgnify:CR=1 FL=1
MATWQTTTRYEDEECQNEKKKSEREILPQIVLVEVERLSQVLILIPLLKLLKLCMFRKLQQ